MDKLIFWDWTGTLADFHIELPGQRDDTGKRRSYANQFFKALKKNLK